MKTPLKRNFFRLPCLLNVYIIDVDDQISESPLDILTEATALDLSNRGLRVKTSLNLPAKSFVCVLVLYKGKKSLCFCNVRWKKAEGKQFLYGFYFKEWSRLDASLAALLRDAENQRFLEDPEYFQKAA